MGAGGYDDFTVVDWRSGDVVMRGRLAGFALLHSPLIAFSHDDKHIVLANNREAQVWNIATATAISSVSFDQDNEITDIDSAPGNSWIVATNKWVKRYDLAGRPITTLTDRGSRACAVSADGRTAVFTDGASLTLHDLHTNLFVAAIPAPNATAFAIAHNGELIAVGNQEGEVTLFEIKSGKKLWECSCASRYRWPWTMPALLLAGWIVAAWRLWRRQARPLKTPSHES